MPTTATAPSTTATPTLLSRRQQSSTDSSTFTTRASCGLWHTNYVSSQYLDNTKNDDRSLPWFTQTNVSLNYTLNVGRKFIGMKEAVFGVDLFNIFDRHYATSGWVYSAYDKKNMKDSDPRYYQIGSYPRPDSR